METNYALIRIISILTSLYILRLIYNYKLKIGHSWFFFILGISFFVLSVWPNAINVVGYITGSSSLISNILFFMIIFLFLIIIHCTLMISSLINRVKELGQELAITSSDIDEEKMKREANAAHAIKASTVVPMFTEETQYPYSSASDSPDGDPLKAGLGTKHIDEPKNRQQG